MKTPLVVDTAEKVSHVIDSGSRHRILTVLLCIMRLGRAPGVVAEEVFDAHYSMAGCE